MGESDIAVIKYSVPLESFMRGDCSGDGDRDLSDAIFILTFLFLHHLEPPCRSACNTNGDGNGIDLSDAISVLEFLFLNGRPPPYPFPACGSVPASELGCAGPSNC